MEMTAEKNKTREGTQHDVSFVVFQGGPQYYLNMSNDSDSQFGFVYQVIDTETDSFGRVECIPITGESQSFYETTEKMIPITKEQYNALKIHLLLEEYQHPTYLALLEEMTGESFITIIHQEIEKVRADILYNREFQRYRLNNYIRYICKIRFEQPIMMNGLKLLGITPQKLCEKWLEELTIF